MMVCSSAGFFIVYACIVIIIVLLSYKNDIYFFISLYYNHINMCTYKYSLKYELVYESEVIDDTFTVLPQLLACIHCPVRMDCRIQINVYYSSSLTAGAEVLLSGVTITLRELMRALTYNDEVSYTCSYVCIFL